MADETTNTPNEDAPRANPGNAGSTNAPWAPDHIQKGQDKQEGQTRGNSEQDPKGRSGHFEGAGEPPMRLP